MMRLTCIFLFVTYLLSDQNAFGFTTFSRADLESRRRIVLSFEESLLSGSNCFHSNNCLRRLPNKIHSRTHDTRPHNLISLFSTTSRSKETSIGEDEENEFKGIGTEEWMTDSMEERLEVLLEEKMKEQGQDKKEEIDRLRRLREEKETEVNRLKFRLQELRNAVEDSEKESMKVEQEVESVKMESEAARLTDKTALAMLTAQFAKAKDALSQQLRDSEEMLKNSQSDLSKEIREAKRIAEEERAPLESEFRSLKSALDDLPANILKAKENIEKMIVGYEMKTASQRDESKRRNVTLNSIALQDKEIFNNLTSELESKLEVAESELLKLENKSAQLKADLLASEMKMEETKEAIPKMVKELKQQLEEDRNTYENSKVTAKQRMRRIIQHLNQRMQRQNKKNAKNLEIAKLEMDNQLESVKKEIDEERLALLLEKTEELARLEAQAEKQLSTRRDEFDTTLMNLNEDALQVENKVLEEMEIYKGNMTKEILHVRTESKKAIESISAEKDDILSVNKKTAQEKYNQFEMSMTQKLIAEKKKRRDLENTLVEKEGRIKTLENNRSSIRKVLKMTLRLARDKSAKLIRKRKHRSQ